MSVTLLEFSGCVLSRNLALLERGKTVMYSRTQNENGTFNTRCLDCLMTIATSVETETDLEMLELRHMCPEKALSHLLAQKASADEHALKN